MGSSEPSGKGGVSGFLIISGYYRVSEDFRKLIIKIDCLNAKNGTFGRIRGRLDR